MAWDCQDCRRSHHILVGADLSPSRDGDRSAFAEDILLTTTLA